MTKSNQMQSIPMRALDNPTHYQLMKNTVDNAKSDKEVMKLVATLVSELDAAVQAEEIVLKTPQKDPLTERIKQADAQRDQDYLFIKETVKANLKNPSQREQQAAQTLQLPISNYRIKISDQYDRETGLMINLLNDMERLYASEVSILGLTEAVKTLRTHNDAFNQLMTERSKDKSKLTTGATQKMRLATDQCFMNLRNALNAQVTLGKADPLSAFINYMNVELNRLKQQVLHKSGVAIDGGGDANTGGGGNDGEEEPPQG
ncbi:MAG: DUF6261 family protein [Prevotellaceae bacterium]|jgi:hypothetical protein|nr:DUF6261 family protein [Prevotellaceae bacterium]